MHRKISQTEAVHGAIAALRLNEHPINKAVYFGLNGMSADAKINLIFLHLHKKKINDEP
jgi:hypothetical protein